MSETLALEAFLRANIGSDSNSCCPLRIVFLSEDVSSKRRCMKLGHRRTVRYNFSPLLQMGHRPRCQPCKPQIATRREVDSSP